MARGAPTGRGYKTQDNKPKFVPFVRYAFAFTRRRFHIVIYRTTQSAVFIKEKRKLLTSFFFLQFRN